VGFADAGWWFSWLAFLSWLACAAVSVVKGKWRLVLVDAFLWLLSYVAAVRLAKPRSLWARKLYGRAKMHRALLRYGGPPSRFELEEMA
jgi:hypothetical protein